MAELAMGVVSLIISVAIMLKSAELNIGWVPGRGPGSGAWPFWLAAGMGLASLATILRWFLRATPESRSREPYIDSDVVGLVGITALSVLGLILMMQYIGTYFAIIIFLAFYLGVIGRHSWKAIFAFCLATTVFIYLLFEVALTKYLPKGLPFFEELFLYVDDIRYDIQYSGHAWSISAAIAVWAGLSVAVGLWAERTGRNGVLAFLLSLIASPVVGFAVYHFTRRKDGPPAGPAEETR
jgi:hypothetical protein